MTNDTCPWPLFDKQETNDIADQLHLSAGLSSGIFLWLLLAHAHPAVDTDRSYQNIGFFMIFAWLRRVTPFLTSFIIDRKDPSRLGMPLCKLFGFLETFMAIHEVGCLTQICIERYVVAKYNVNGWHMPIRHYYMFRLLSLLFAGAYSLAAAAMSAGYGPDFTCLSCTMNMMLPDTDGMQKYCIMGLFFLRSIKPVGFMIGMLYWAKQLESKLSDAANNREQRETTKDVVINFLYYLVVMLTAVNLICWIPIAIIQASVILSQHFSGPRRLALPAPFYVKVALLLHWSSHACSTIALLMLIPRIRKAAFNLRHRHAPEELESSKIHKKE